VASSFATGPPFPNYIPQDFTYALGRRRTQRGMGFLGWSSRFAELQASLRPITRSMWIVYINVSMYALCYQMQTPVLPYLVKSLGAGTRGYGTMMTTFGVVQFFGGLLAGPLADTYSGELLLLLSFGASALCYFFTAGASTMWMLYLSRLPTVLQHAVLAARTIITDQTNEVDRARMIGYVGLAYGVGFLIGPGLGGLVSSSHLQSAAWMATVGSLMSMVLIVYYLPASRSFTQKAPIQAPNPEEGLKAAPSKLSRFNPKEMWRVCTIKGIPSLLSVKILSGMGLGLFHAIFALVAADRFGMTTTETGLVMSFVGGLTMLSQAFLIEWATNHFAERNIIQFCSAVLGGGFLLLAMAQTASHLYITMVALVPAGCLLGTVNTSQLTKAAPKDSGTIIAIDMSVGSMVHIVTPTVSTYILATYGYPAVLVTSGSLCFALLGLINVGMIIT